MKIACWMFKSCSFLPLICLSMQVSHRLITISGCSVQQAACDFSGMFSRLATRCRCDTFILDTFTLAPCSYQPTAASCQRSPFLSIKSPPKNIGTINTCSGRKRARTDKCQAMITNGLTSVARRTTLQCFPLCQWVVSYVWCSTAKQGTKT